MQATPAGSAPQGRTPARSEPDGDPAGRRLSPLNLAFFAAVHAGAIASLAWFSWTNLAVMLVLYVATGLGITVGYHRLLAHHAFRVPPWLERALATVGAMAMQGGPITWVSDHRQHHFHADHEGDPHDIERGLFFAHMGWLCYANTPEVDRRRNEKYARDLCASPYLRWLERYHYLPGVCVGIALALAGGVGLFLWGFCTRVVVLYHATWMVNSVAHKWGYRPFADAPGTNSWLVAALAFGEGWHNNHHAWPGSARQGLRAWELDPSWLAIAALARLRLAREVRVCRLDRPRPGAGRMVEL